MFNRKSNSFSLVLSTSLLFCILGLICTRNTLILNIYLNIHEDAGSDPHNTVGFYDIYWTT